jgi:hypothetical protein
LQARFSVVDGTPTVREPGVQQKGGTIPMRFASPGAGSRLDCIAVKTEREVNLGSVWHRRDIGNTFSLGIRQVQNPEGYNPTWSEKLFVL